MRPDGPLRSHTCPACDKRWRCLANRGWPPRAEPLPCVYPVALLCLTCVREEQP